MPQPVLKGVRVVELATMAAVPSAAAVLADLGADVVKVERPGTGDPWRRTGRQFQSGDEDFGAMFEQDNRGKRGIALDLTLAAHMVTPCHISVCEHHASTTLEV